ncbi:MAG TPA: YraN family protein [Anaerohalosphaeraceae bacterium]|jgi:putative endonuclease|nr:YraN family protein [Anaerohalosphaeraceae bacterium]HRT50618.1 YraN family protein [Anaerohalosphaeraceae bacterium]HRT86557.1 YraN family protein [Anaerohalosphaeraceae bacterium]
MPALPFIRRRLLSDPKRLGRWGEKRCEKHLKARGYRTIARNYRCAMGEIDLVMADPDGTLVFIEVKTRRNEDYARAHDAVTPRKRIRMARAAEYFRRIYRIKDRPLRFDVVAVVLGDGTRAVVTHYPNAFIPRS